MSAMTLEQAAAFTRDVLCMTEDDAILEVYALDARGAASVKQAQLAMLDEAQIFEFVTNRPLGADVPPDLAGEPRHKPQRRRA